MKVTPLKLPGVLLVEADVHRDSRGQFVESWSEARYRQAGLPASFVQDNVSWSRGGVIRGLHCQSPNAQGKLISVVHGQIFDVAVDVRRDSPTFGEWISTLLSAGDGHQVFVPAGFAHGFAVVSPMAAVTYKCTDYYVPGSELTVLWNDPDLAIEWPVSEPALSDKDKGGLRLREVPRHLLPDMDPRSG